MALAQLIVHFCYVGTAVGVTEYNLPLSQLIIMVVTTVVVAAGGFVVNDYFDMRIDEINRPLTKIVGNKIGRHETMTYYVILLVVGLVLSIVLGFLTQSFFLCFVFFSVVGLLWFYSSSYKRILGLGNIMVAFAVALVPFIVAMFEQRYVPVWWAEQISMRGYEVTSETLKMANPTISLIYTIVGTISLIIFGWIFVLEIVRNLEEENGEREMECHTFPIVWGQQTARYIAITVVVLINVFCCAALLVHLEALKPISLSYFVCTSVAFSAALIYFIKVADHRRDYKICRLLLYLILASVICYGFVFASVNPFNEVPSI